MVVDLIILLFILFNSFIELFKYIYKSTAEYIKRNISSDNISNRGHDSVCTCAAATHLLIFNMEFQITSLTSPAKFKINFNKIHTSFHWILKITLEWNNWLIMDLSGTKNINQWSLTKWRKNSKVNTMTWAYTYTCIGHVKNIVNECGRYIYTFYEQLFNNNEFM